MESQVSFQKKQIIFRLLDGNQRATDFLFEPDSSVSSLRERPEVLAEESWEFTNEEKVLIQVALDIWSGHGNAFVWELLQDLSDKDLDRVMVAIFEFRDMKELNK